ncbi:lysozyme family protein [Pseudogracilibacillus sp. SO30301A]|uniref:lysozyme family protein n=1 Tax=Pseudogracilibacillus sp. SO30301A TaxID=3098291 RepID=UPI00300DC85B
MKCSGYKVFIRVFALVFMMSLLLVGVSLYTSKDEFKKGKIVQHVFTKKVEQYRSTVEKYAIEFDVEEHTDVLLAMMLQESGGRGDDPMQSSESLCGEVGCITDPEQSIKQGVSYFAEALQAADGEIELAIQAYNFGIGFIYYLKKNKQSYNQDTTIKFSQEMYKNADDPSLYTCLREEAKQYDACYGDIFYAQDVMEYKQKFVTN